MTTTTTKPKARRVTRSYLNRSEGLRIHMTVMIQPKGASITVVTEGDYDNEPTIYIGSVASMRRRWQDIETRLLAEGFKKHGKDTIHK